MKPSWLMFRRFFSPKSERIDKYFVFKLLELSTFSDSELKKSHARLTDHGNSLRVGLKQMLVEQTKEKNGTGDLDRKVDDIACFLFPTKQHNELTKDTVGLDEFKVAMKRAAEKLDSRVTAIGMNFFLTGISIGIIIPCMPLLVQELGMTSQEFGVVVAAPGFSKLVSNIPSAFFVDRLGRKPVMIAGLGLCAFGLGGVGLTLLPGFGVPWLITCRLLTGCGVSFFVGGAIMLMGDISTSLNRTRTMAPVLAAFQGGTAVGPALGGPLVEKIGLSSTYGSVGGLFGLITAANYIFLKETLPPVSTSSNSSTGTCIPNTKESSERLSFGAIASFKTAYLKWKELVKVPALRNVTILNSAYWTAFAGTQMTLLPLFMVSSDHMNFGATELGMTFAYMSVISVIASQPVAYFADRQGKVRTIIAGCCLMSTTMALIPHAGSFEELLAVLLPFALGSTALSSAPTALVTNLTSQLDRSQALAMLRTSGDVGHLIGAFSAGLMAHFSTLQMAMYADCGLLTAAMVWYTVNSRKIVETAGQPIEKNETS